MDHSMRDLLKANDNLFKIARKYCIENNRLRWQLRNRPRVVYVYSPPEKPLLLEDRK